MDTDEYRALMRRLADVCAREARSGTFHRSTTLYDVFARAGEERRDAPIVPAAGWNEDAYSRSIVGDPRWPRLWLLRPTVGGKDPNRTDDPWLDVGGAKYNAAFGFVIRAQSENDARALASANAGDEGADAWTDPAWASCVRLTDAGENDMVMCDFRA
jgi:hypothetical protein